MRIDNQQLQKIGFGCLQLEGINEDAAVNIIVKAYELGVRLFDTAAAYGADRHNEKLLSKAICKIEEKYGKAHDLFFSTKCGINFNTMYGPERGYESSPEEIRASVEKSLLEFNVSQIPLVYLHRIDPQANDNSVRDSLNELKKLVEEGKIKYVGLSECSARQIRMADEIFKMTELPYNPFAFVQFACSISTRRAFHNEVLDVCREKGIQFVSYTSVVRGLVNPLLSENLTEEELEWLEPKEIIERLKQILAIPQSDFKLYVGFFSEDVIKTNLKCIISFQKLAKEYGVSPSQLALAWQVANGMIPIPGTTNLEHLEMNVKAGTIQLSNTQLEAINGCFQDFKGNPNIDGVLDDASLEVLQK